LLMPLLVETSSYPLPIRNGRDARARCAYCREFANEEVICRVHLADRTATLCDWLNESKPPNYEAYETLRRHSSGHELLDLVT